MLLPVLLPELLSVLRLPPPPRNLHDMGHEAAAVGLVAARLMAQWRSQRRPSCFSGCCRRWATLGWRGWWRAGSR